MSADVVQIASGEPTNKAFNSTNNVVASDVLKNLEDEKVREIQYQSRLKEVSQKAEQERQLLQKTVYDNANPNPILVTVCIISVIAILYLAYILLLKPCMSGTWIDKTGTNWDISHNKFSNKFTILIDGEYGGSGKVYDNYVQYGELVGVWNYGDHIQFTDGWGLTRLD